MSGLHAEVIVGYEKHDEYDPAQSYDAESESLDDLIGTSTAILVDKTWRMVNANHCWDLSQFVLQNQENRTAVPCDEQHFFTDPEEAIYLFFPEDPAWQLLARPVTQAEFFSMPFIRPEFYRYDLDLQSHAICNITQNPVELEFNVRRIQGLHFGYELKRYKSDGSFSETYKGIDLNRYVLLETTSTSVICRINCPAKCRYVFELLVRRCDEHNDTSAYDFDVLVTYIINCDKINASVKPLPSNLRQEWGCGGDLLNAGIHPHSHHNARIKADDGNVDLTFRAGRNIEVLYELRNSSDEKCLSKRAVVSHKDIKLQFKLTEIGVYALDIYAKENHESVLFQLICTYLVEWDNTRSSSPIYIQPKQIILEETDMKKEHILTKLFVDEEVAKIDYDDLNYDRDLKKWQDSITSVITTGRSVKQSSILEKKPKYTNGKLSPIRELNHLKGLPPIVVNSTASGKPKVKNSKDKRLLNRSMRKNVLSETNNKVRKRSLDNKENDILSGSTRNELKIYPFWKEETENNIHPEMRSQTPPTLWSSSEEEFSDSPEVELEKLMVPSSRLSSRLTQRKTVLGSRAYFHRSKSRERDARFKKASPSPTRRKLTRTQTDDSSPIQQSDKGRLLMFSKPKKYVYREFNLIKYRTAFSIKYTFLQDLLLMMKRRFIILKKYFLGADSTLWISLKYLS